MAGNEKPIRGAISEQLDHHVRFVGGTNAVTKVTDTGPGITVTYVSAGIVDLVWSENPGLFVNAVGSFSATTTANVKSFTFTHGVFNTTTFTLRINMHDSGTLTNLAALQWLGVHVVFKRSGTGV